MPSAMLLVAAVVAGAAGPLSLLAADTLWRLRVRRSRLQVVGQIVEVEPSGFRVGGTARFRLTLAVDLNAGAPVRRSRWSYRAPPGRRAKAMLRTRAIVTVPEGLASTVRRGDWATMLLDPADLKRALVEAGDLGADPPVEDTSATPMVG